MQITAILNLEFNPYSKTEQIRDWWEVSTQQISQFQESKLFKLSMCGLFLLEIPVFFLVYIQI